MAYFVEMAQTFNGVAGGVLPMNMPEHQADDILIMIVSVDSGAMSISASSSTWTLIGTNPTTSGILVAAWWLKAPNGTQTVTTTTADAMTGGIYCFRDVDPTTPFDGVTPLFTAVAASSTPVNQALTSTTADALIFNAIAQEGTVQQCLSDPGFMSITNFDSTGTTATTSAHQSAAWYIQRTAGVTPFASWSGNASNLYVRLSLVLRNKTGGRIPAYVDDITAPATRLTGGHHIGTLNNISFPAALTATAAINTKTAAFAAAAVGADFGINPYANAIGRAAAIVAKTSLGGYEIALTGGRNLSTGLIMGSLIAGTPKMGTFGLGRQADGGYVVRVGSAAGAWCAYQVAASDSVPTTEQRSVFAIQAGYTGSSYGTPGTAVTTTAVTFLQFLMNAPAFASTVYLSELHHVQKQIVSGGDATFPVDTNGMVQIGSSFRLPVIQKAGGAGLISYAPIQIGGGDAVNFQINSGTLQFPRRYSTASKELGFHAADNAVGISYAGKAGDVIYHTDSLVSSPTPFYWEINTAATNAAAWDFTGLSIIGANVTLRNVTTFDGMNFTSCPSLNFSSCTVLNSKISKLPATNDSLTTNASTAIQYTEVNTTTVTAGNRFCSVANPTIFQDCNFYGSATSGHAIRITTPGTYTFAGNNFNNYGANGTTSAAIFNDSGGLVTLNVINFGGTPTFRNGTGASTVVNNSVALTFTGIVNDSEIRIYSRDGSGNSLDELAGTENVVVNEFTYTYNFAANTFVNVVILHNEYQYYALNNLLLGSTTSSIPVQQIADRQYNNPLNNDILINDHTVLDSRSSGQTATASYRLSSSGYAQKSRAGTNAGAYENIEQWISPLTNMSDFECRATLTVGILPSGTFDTWIPLTSDTTWSHTRSADGSTSGTFTLQIRKVGTTAILDSAGITITATISNAG